MEGFYKFSCFFNELQNGEVKIEYKRYTVHKRSVEALKEQINCFWYRKEKDLSLLAKVGAIWFIDAAASARREIHLHWGAKFCRDCH